MIVIYDPSGKKLIETVVSDRSNLYISIDNRKELTLVFSLDRHVDIPIGSWCDFEGSRYELMSEADIKMINTVGYSYSAVFSSEFSRTSLFKVVNTVDGRMKFDMVAKPIEHLQMIVDNLNERDYGWDIGSCIDSVEKLISYNHTSCDKALADIAEVFETEVEVLGKTISLGKIEYNKDNPIELSYGKDKGIRSGVTKTNDGALPVRRLFVQGGSRNISLKDYGSAELHLPKELEFYFDGEFFDWESKFDEYKAKYFVTDAKGSYLEINDENAIREDSIDLTHIYPSREGKVDNVIFVYKNIDYPSPLGSWTEEDLNEVQIDFVDSTIPGSLDYNECLLENNEPLTVVFQSGMLAGREFSASYVSDKKRFRLVKQEFDGQPMPQGVFIPKIGDTYAVFNVSLPASYISDPSSHTGAEYKVLREASRSLYDLSEKKFSFSGEIDGIWSKKNWDSVGSRIKIGSYVRFTHDKMFPNTPVMVRIVGITQYVNNPYSPKIEISNNVGVSSLSTRLSFIESQGAHVEELHKESKRYAKRRFSDVSQTLDMLKGAFDNFSEGINPVTVETMSMLVGDERLQFVFTEALSSDVEKDFIYTYKSKADVLEGEDESQSQGKNQIVVSSAFIKHMTLGIDNISPVHASDEYMRWSLPEKRFLLDPAKGYYIYAYVSDVSSAGEFVVSDSALKDDGSSHYLLIGILNSEYDGQRSFARMYGYTEVRPGQIVTEEIRSSDGKTWLDLVRGILHLNDLAGVSGIKDTQKGDKSIAAWFGGLMEDLENDENPVNPAKSVLRHDGTGYFAEGLFKWDIDEGINLGNGAIKINYDGSVEFGGDIHIGGTGDETLDSILGILANLTNMFTWLDEDEHTTIFTDKNLVVGGDISDGGTGEAVVGVTGIRINGKDYYDEDWDGIIDISTALGNLNLSNYYTKDEVNNLIAGLQPDEENDMFTWLDEEHTAIVAESSLIVKGDISDEGTGEAVVGVTGILINGDVYYGEDGIIDLSAAIGNNNNDADLSDKANGAYALLNYNDEEVIYMDGDSIFHVGDIIPEYNYNYYIGTDERYYKCVSSNGFFAGSTRNNLWLLAGSYDGMKIIFGSADSCETSFGDRTRFAELGGEGLQLNVDLILGDTVISGYDNVVTIEGSLIVEGDVASTAEAAY